MRRLCILGLVGLILGGDPAEPVKIDASHSTLAFHVPILDGLSRVTCKFSRFEAELLLDPADLSKARLTAIIDASSIDSGIDERDADLRGEDFLDTARFPRIEFRSETIEKSADGYIAKGRLDLHGVSRPIRLTFVETGRKESKDGRGLNIGYRVQGSLNRRDFGVNWTHSIDKDFVGDVLEIDGRLISKWIARRKS